MHNDQIRQIRRALISVSDKTGLLPLAQLLADKGVEILSTGGTAKLLQQNQIAVTEVSEHTGFPEIMDGRVKTLHPKIHGGILGRGDNDEKVMRDNKIDSIDLVIVNLYPFEKTIAAEDCTEENAIENIDIGGPTMIRAAAKNFKYVTVVTDAADYAAVSEQINATGGTNLALRKQLAARVFHQMARYDGAISNYFASLVSTTEDSDTQAEDTSAGLNEVFNLQLTRQQSLRYGENPHQKAAFYRTANAAQGTISNAVLRQGKALSYNNIGDADAAWQCVNAFAETACVIVKHANPCGVALADDINTAYEKAYQGDPVSAFGGIIAFNRALDKPTAENILGKQFVEVIIAPSVNEDALPVLASKPNIRVLDTQGLLQNATSANAPLELKTVSGGMLIQQSDMAVVGAADLTCATEKQPDEAVTEDLLFAWKVVKFTKSNAIVFAKNKQTIGIGAGQMSRVYSAKIAAIKAEEEGFDIRGAVMASDAFFPFRDTVDNASEIGISAIIQPGGSMRDEEVIASANEHNMVMMFTGVRHFKH